MGKIEEKKWEQIFHVDDRFKKRNSHIRTHRHTHTENMMMKKNLWWEEINEENQQIIIIVIINEN